MLADDAAASDIALGPGGLVEVLPKGAIHLSMSTISVAFSKRLAEAHAQSGQRYVAAPVFGRPDMAAAAKLFIVAAGDPGAIDACRPVLDALGQKTSTMGAEPSAANLVKLTANFLQAAVIESLGEAIALIGRRGIDRRAYVDLLTSTIFTAPAYKIFGPLIADGTFGKAAFAAPLGFKDIRLALAEAETLRVPMPLASLLHDRFLRLFAQGGENWIGRPSVAWRLKTPAASKGATSRGQSATLGTRAFRDILGGSCPMTPKTCSHEFCAMNCRAFGFSRTSARSRSWISCRRPRAMHW